MVLPHLLVMFWTHTTCLLYPRGTFDTSSTHRSGMACPIDLPVMPVMEASYVTTSRVVGACNAGLQVLNWGACDPLDHWRFLCWNLTKSSRAFNFVFASVWMMDTHSRKFSNLSGFGSDLQRQSKRRAVRDIVFHKVQASYHGSRRRWPCAIWC